MSPTHAEVERHLKIYLRDHRAGAAAGVALAERMAHSGAHEPAVTELAAELADSRDRLEHIMRAMGITPSRPKQLLGRAVELLSRIKTNGRLVRRSPLSTLVELETLTGGLAVQLSLWLALTRVAGQLPPDLCLEPARLVQRVEAQLQLIRQLQERATDAALAAP